MVLPAATEIVNCVFVMIQRFASFPFNRGDIFVDYKSKVLFYYNIIRTLIYACVAMHAGSPRRYVLSRAAVLNKKKKTLLRLAVSVPQKKSKAHHLLDLTVCAVLSGVLSTRTDKGYHTDNPLYEKKQKNNICLKVH